MNVLFFTSIGNPRILSCSLSLGVRVEVFSLLRKSLQKELWEEESGRRYKRKHLYRLETVRRRIRTDGTKRYIATPK